MNYPITLTPDDNDTYLVTFPDFPEATTFGADRDEAIARAVDALETVIDAYIRDRRPIPTPSAPVATGARSAQVALPALVATKVQIYDAMRQQQVGKAALAKRLNVHLPQIDRLLDVRHGSKLDQLEAAAQALGGRLDIKVVLPTMTALTMRDFPRDAMVVGGKATAAVAASPRRRRFVPPRVHAGVLKRSKSDGRRVAAKKK